MEVDREALEAWIGAYGEGEDKDVLGDKIQAGFNYVIYDSIYTFYTSYKGTKRLPRVVKDDDDEDLTANKYARYVA